MNERMNKARQETQTQTPNHSLETNETGDTRLNPTLMQPKTILQLQRTIGNSAVSRMVNKTAQSKSPIQREEAQQAADTDVNKENIDWATTTNTSIEGIQNAVSTAIDRLNDDAQVAIQHIRAAQEKYSDFSNMYESAVSQFVSGVEAAQAKEQEFRDNLKFVATTILASAAPTVSAIYKAMDGTVTKINSITSIVGPVLDPKPATAPDTSGGNSPAMAAHRENRVDWNELLTTTLTAFQNTLENNVSLKGIGDSCIQIVRFLGRVKDGSYAGDPRADALALQADKMVTDSEKIIMNLQAIDKGTVSGPTGEMEKQITERLAKITQNKLQQDIAIRWMAGLSDKERDHIDKAEDYLGKIGVFDEGDNRLGYDTGLVTDSFDETVLHWRAQWEAKAMDLVGSTATWLGGQGCEGRTYRGRVRDQYGEVWNVNIPEGAPTEGGGEVLLQSYQVSHGDPSRPVFAKLRHKLSTEITFTAQPASFMGGMGDGTKALGGPGTGTPAAFAVKP